MKNKGHIMTRVSAMQKMAQLCALALALAVALPATPSFAADLFVLASRSTLVKTARPMGEVIVADPEVADVRAHGSNYLSVVGRKQGATTIRLFDKDRNLIQTYTVTVGYDLVAIRQALGTLLPSERIGVEMVGGNVALTGQVANAETADKAVRIAGEFMKDKATAAAPVNGASVADTAAQNGVINMLKVTSGQQVMLRVRVGEVQRDALKRLGIDPAAATGSGNFFLQGGLGVASAGRLALGNPALTTDYTIPPDQFRGTLAAGWRGSNDAAFAVIKALERDGLYKLLAEPNLVAVSGEQAEFLAGGEIPIPVPQSTGGANTTLTIEYKPFGVAVKFKPFVLTESRIRMEVAPEVSELDSTNALNLQGYSVPAISTRRAKTVVELAPGESFMIAGLIKDQTRSSIDQLPGVKELPVLGALFRSTDFQRNETELVISVTPYIVDPVKSGDIRLPTDNFAPASQMEMFFYGALGSLSGDAARISQSPTAEGPIGFMVD